VILSSGGGLTEVGVSLEEYNLLGYGKDVFVEGVHESDVGTRWSAGYVDPQLLNSNWSLYSIFSNGPLIKAYEIFVKKPMFSIDSRWSFGGGGYTADEIERLFTGGVEISRFNADSDHVTAFVTRAYGKRFKKTRLSLSYRYDETKFSPIVNETTLPLAPDELIYATSISIGRDNIRYVKTKQLDKFVTTEDFVMGRRTVLTVGRAGFPVAKGLKRWEFDVSHRQSHQFGPSRHLFANIGFEYEEARNEIVHGGVRYYHRLGLQTFSSNLIVKWAPRLEESKQFLLGGNSGLRGYPAREFSGDRKILINIESRVVPSWEIATIQLGGVVFFDTGNVWNRTVAFDLGDLNHSAGVGLRFGFPKMAGASVARIDVGWPLNRSGDAVFTLGAEQHF
jgi:outer membrane protein assembly factor BamA